MSCLEWWSGKISLRRGCRTHQNVKKVETGQNVLDLSSPIEMSCKTQVILILIGATLEKNKQVKLILIMYFIELNLSKMFSIHYYISK